MTLQAWEVRAIRIAKLDRAVQEDASWIGSPRLRDPVNYLGIIFT